MRPFFPSRLALVLVASSFGLSFLAVATPLKFDHKVHSDLEKPVPVQDCALCHGNDSLGVLSRPAAAGHQPCLNAGCHAQDFLAVGKRTRKEAKARYTKAARFCMGCHQSKSSSAPSPFRKAPADNLYRWNGTEQKREHHVEMDHLAHVRRTACSTCHTVDATTFMLAERGPNHKECATCHGESEEALEMPQCEGCHQAGSPQDYFKARSSSSDVRSCGSARYIEQSKKRRGRSLPCFEHEHRGHRFRKDESPVECIDCHFMFKSKTYAGHRYQTLKDVKQAPMMDNHRDRAHQKCGTSGCHRRAVDESFGTGRCSLCHSSKAIIENLFEEVSDE